MRDAFRSARALTATAHCDLPCGVYDPAQARIEAESVKAIMEKYQGNDDPVFRTRALIIKEQRAELVKHHLWVLWTDYFKPPHFEKYPQLHDLFNKATKAARRRRRQGLGRPGQGPEAARPDRGDRHDLLGDQDRGLTTAPLRSDADQRVSAVFFGAHAHRVVLTHIVGGVREPRTVCVSRGRCA